MKIWNLKFRFRQFGNFGVGSVYTHIPLRYRRLLAFSVVLITIQLIRLSGIHLQLFFEKDYFTQFEYPLESEEFIEIVNEFRTTGAIRSQIPINMKYSTIPFLTIANNKDCGKRSYQLLLLVKSAPGNIQNRQAIRETWLPPPDDLHVKLAFFMGKPETTTVDLGREIKEEMEFYQDIVLLDYIDTYYNNTIKTMLEMKWAAEYCSNFQYALLVDDDYYVSVQNLLKFTERLRGIDKAYAGFVMFTRPLRHQFFNKWYVTIEEYPFNRWPKYVTAGAILLSKSALLDIYYASFFVKHFRFDDIYVALCAKKMKIEPIHSEEFRFWEKTGELYEKDLIAAHGYRDYLRLRKFWKVQHKMSEFV